MIKELQLVVSPQTAFTEALLKSHVLNELGLSTHDTFTIETLRRSIDARGRNIKINVKVRAYINELPQEQTYEPPYKTTGPHSKTVTIIGAGPAGLFAALQCLELGYKPVVFERGKDVQARRRDLAAINKEHIVNPESNYCFGEGGAGTYSDGKLYTRSNKRGDIEHVLRTFVYHGASGEILVDAHPHIGTNKLPNIIVNMRETIRQYGGEIHFGHRLADLVQKKGKITAVLVQNQETGHMTEHACEQLILATGHSARDIYELLHRKNILVEAKPFAMGVRAEHPQSIIDSIQYHCGSLQELTEKRQYLPAASYSLVHQVNGYGVYSFCMCPGGIIAPCATGPEQVVTNGWSPSKRNNPYANSGIVVGLELRDFEMYKQFGPLAGLEFQKQLEKQAWLMGGQTQTAPAQRLQDFVNNKTSNDLPDCSYQPGLKPVAMNQVLGKLIGQSLQQGFKAFGQKMRGYLTNEALIVGVESRTSTPVRIPRDKDTLLHPELSNLYPCAEGAGYAGGIMSAAMDGINCVKAIHKGG
ncbi:MAG: FAD-binding protein [Bacteroidetes bacterium]|nr:FAD-binding protein [Bacteroidota bacterium]